MLACLLGGDRRVNATALIKVQKNLGGLWACKVLQGNTYDKGMSGQPLYTRRLTQAKQIGRAKVAAF